MGLLTSLFSPPRYRATAAAENPRFPLNSQTAVDALRAGSDASSGVEVTRETALTYGPWWRGINLLAAGVAKLPLLTYRVAGATKQRDPMHPAWRLLRRRPNARQTAFDFKRQLTGHALSGGNGYAAIVRDGGARPMELLPLDPGAVTPTMRDGLLWYVVRLPHGEDSKLRAEDVLHVKGYGFDGIMGYSVVAKARESLGLGMGQKKYAATYFKNNARPSVVLETPNKMKESAIPTLRDMWNQMHAGIDNAHKTAVLDNGMKANILSFSAADSQLIESQQFTARDVANFLGLPPHKVGDDARTAYASLEQENLAYLGDSLDPWLIAWEEECYLKLLTEEEQMAESALVEFHRQELLRSDRVSMSNANRSALGGAPWKTQNEARADDGLDPIAGGDEIPKPLNIQQGRPGGSPPPGQEPQ